MRVTAPERPILSRADALDQTVLTIDFVSAGHNDIAVTLYHDMGYESHEPRFELNVQPDPVELDINDEEAVLKSFYHAGDTSCPGGYDGWRYYCESRPQNLCVSI